MQQIRPLSEDERISSGTRQSVAHDPKRQYAAVD
jgi:hypothetical protein